LYLSNGIQKKAIQVFEEIISEQKVKEDGVHLMISALLMQLFLLINREIKG